MPRVNKLISICNIEVDRWPMNRDTFNLALFLRDGGTVPAIKVQETGNGQYRIRDGRHRVLAFKLLGRETIEARIGLCLRCPHCGKAYNHDQEGVEPSKSPSPEAHPTPRIHYSETP